MSNIAEIETAIENLPIPQVDELATRLEALRMRRATSLQIEIAGSRAWFCSAGYNHNKCNGPHSGYGMSGFLFDASVLWGMDPRQTVLHGNN